jgi:four helix bundle protein
VAGGQYDESDKQGERKEEEMAVKRFEDLIVWQKGIELVEQIYRASARFPKEELYAMASQLRRAAVSVPSNIAEGQSRQTSKEFLNFLSIARGSLAEVHTQIIIAARLKYVGQPDSEKLLDAVSEVRKLLSGLIRSLRSE